MESAITVDNIQEILATAKQQFADIAILNYSGEWSSQYFGISEVKEMNSGSTVLAVLVSLQDSHFEAMDVRLIRGLRFNKYVNFHGTLAGEVVVR